MQGDDYLSDENLAAYLTYTSSTEEALRSGVPVVYDPNQVIPVEGLSDVESTHRENGRTEYEEPIDLDSVVDTTFTETALELLGEYESMDAMGENMSGDDSMEGDNSEENSDD